ncbi:MAG: DUF4377 domain-containing protein [Bacteroidaceae bacterium]
MPFGGIIEFTYPKGHEYVLSVEKTTLANPPMDNSKIRYKLIKIINDILK